MRGCKVCKDPNARWIIGHDEICHECSKTHHLCYDCGAVCVSAECANGTRCDHCWYTDASIFYSKPDTQIRFQGGWRFGLTETQTDRLFSQLAALPCRTCGGKLLVRTNSLTEMRFLYVWCDSYLERHQWVAFVDLEGNVIEVYDDSPWRWAAGSWRDPAEFEPWENDEIPDNADPDIEEI